MTKKLHSQSPPSPTTAFIECDVKKIPKKVEDEFGLYKKTHRAEVKMPDFLKVVLTATEESDELGMYARNRKKLKKKEAHPAKGGTTTGRPTVDSSTSKLKVKMVKPVTYTHISFKNDEPGGAIGYEIEADDIADRFGSCTIDKCRKDRSNNRSTENEQAVDVRSSSEYGHVINDCTEPSPLPALPPLPDDSPQPSPRVTDPAAYPAAATKTTCEDVEEERKGKDVDIPKDLICPITGDLMEDPVVAADGFTYERTAISKWYRRFPLFCRPRSPTTNQEIGSRTLFPNYTVRSQCREFARIHGVTVGEERVA